MQATNPEQTHTRTNCPKEQYKQPFPKKNEDKDEMCIEKKHKQFAKRKS